MFPNWYDHEFYKVFKEIFNNHKEIFRYKDMWTDKIGSYGTSILFW